MGERYISPQAKPTPRDAELLTILIEECSELQKRATKMLRFGILEVQPGQQLDNRKRLGLEAGDVLAMIALCDLAGLIVTADVDRGVDNKKRQLEIYFQGELPR